MKVIITKYAMSTGAFQVEAEQSDVIPSMVTYLTDGRWSNAAHGEGREWHRTIESAQKRFNEMKAKKIASLAKQMKKIENLKFEVMVK